MGKINILDKKVYNRIAAGEVVERPFSVVKELIENSLDAGAKNISIDIYSGGKDLIQIIDDGSGIEKDDLPKAILPHATSKIANENDLDKIRTLGFRGEALASIASVSKMTIISRTNNSQVGYKISVEDERVSDVEVAPSEVGTFISVENLFYNTPARAKFLKPDHQEEADITNIIKRLILSRSDVAFKYTIDGSLALQSFGDGLSSAIIQVYGYEAVSKCYEIDTIKNGIRIRGFLSKENFTKPNKTYQTVILNKRYVINSTISNAVYYVYKPHLMTRQYPFFVLLIDMPEEFVDVNVHPNKIDVRFVDNETVYNTVHTVVKSVFTTPTGPDSVVLPENYFSKNGIRHITDSIPSRVAEKPPVSKMSTVPYRKTLNKDAYLSHANEYVEVNTKLYEKEDKEAEDIFLENKKYIAEQERLKALKEEKIKQEEMKFDKTFKIVGQALNTYIILERDGDLYFVDQHAAHERLLYDKILEDFKNNSIAKQDLLVPFTYNINDSEYDFVIKMLVPLRQLGFNIVESGYNEFCVFDIPLELFDIDLKAFFDDFLSDLNFRKEEVPEIIREKLAQKSCKAAIKSGKVLSDSEIKALINALNSDLSLKCPHGRPIALKITRTEIDKWFKRIV